MIRWHEPLFYKVHHGVGFVSIWLAAFFGALAIIFVAWGSWDFELPLSWTVPRRSPPISTVEHRSLFMSKDFFDRAYNQAPAFPSPTERMYRSQPVGIILPHHLVAAPLIASTLEEAKRHAPEGGWRRVVIIGPDHLHRATAGAVTTHGVWKTPYGTLLPDDAFITHLEKQGVAVDETVFDADHSISTLVSFIKRSLPGAKIVPIMVNSRLSIDHPIPDLIDLDGGPGPTLFIASVDFSHYLPDRVARLHDRMSRAVLSSREYLSDLDDLEVDSAESLLVFLRAIDHFGPMRMTTAWNTTSAELTATPDLAETTSHLIALFHQGEPERDNTTTLLAVGDMMFDRNVRGWMQKEGEEYPFARIRGAEDRFFRGVDVVMGNLEGAIASRQPPEKEIDFAFDTSTAALIKKMGFDVVSLANNHNLDQGRDGVDSTHRALTEVGVGFFGDQVHDDTTAWETEVRGKKIAFLGYNTTDNPLNEAEAEAAVRLAKTKNDTVVVMMHWGTEYTPRPPQSVINHGRKMIDWGADVVIGAHPHVMQGMEVYNGKPIFWSLGNFIFDQYWSTETERGLAVGLALSKNETTIYLYPIVSQHSQPRLAIGDEDRALLNAFAERSDLSEDLRAQAKTGIITLPSP